MKIQPLLIYFFLIWGLTYSSCKKPEHPSRNHSPDNVSLKIPVVVHVLYDEEKYNISDEKIHSQIEVLNRDFNLANVDLNELKAAAANMQIQFFLANQNPEGDPATGIIRKFTPIDASLGRTPANLEKPGSELALYHTSMGGSDIWPADKYLNIYVVIFSTRTGKLAMPGYAQFPGKDPQTDAIVIDPRCFGTLQPLLQGFHLGRTTTHEVGHWLDLRHVFDSTDFVEDTPEGGMPLNFMNYDTDDKLLVFTQGQKKRVYQLFTSEGKRHQLYENIK